MIEANYTPLESFGIKPDNYNNNKKRSNKGNSSGTSKKGKSKSNERRRLASADS